MPENPPGPGDAAQAWRIGNFQVVKLLGEGAMGTVYLGAHDTLHRKVAIKILHPQLAATPQLVDRFIDEARSVSALGHPTLVQILDFGRLPDGRLYSVMEYLDGSDLAQALAKSGRFDPARAAKLTADVASGLAIVHDAGIVHRDLKPENLYLARNADGTEQVKILDFGIAKLLDLDGGGSARRTSAGSVLGTPAYLSPEQAKAGAVDGRADQYSLGVVLYELLAGRPPFRSQNPMELLVAHAMEAPPPLGPLAPAAPPALVAVAERCLAKEPGARFPHMRDLRNALLTSMGLPGGTQQDGSLAASPRSTLVAAPPAGGSRLGLFAGIGLALVAAGGAAFALIGGGGGGGDKQPVATPPPPVVSEPASRTTAVPDAQTAQDGSKNPFAADDRGTLAAGAAIYTSKCARCHGNEGMGDGPDTPTGLEPKSFADSRVYPGELDVYRFNIVKHGIQQEKDGDYAMPSFAVQLADREIWQVVTFLGTMSAPPPQLVDTAPQEPKPAFDDALVDQGKKLFAKKCVTCHGQSGKGNGRAAEYLGRMPANLTKGQFKLRSTAKNKLPTDEDLFRTVTTGMGVGGMPGFAKLPERDRWALVAHVKTLSRRFAEEKEPPAVLEIGKPPPGGAAAIEAGRVAFANAGCPKCHGKSGRGDGPRAGTLDDSKRPIAPPDFTQRFTFIGGTEPTDVYRTMMTGISGTAMPSGENFFDDEVAWKVVYYIISLSDASR